MRALKLGGNLMPQWGPGLVLTPVGLCSGVHSAACLTLVYELLRIWVIMEHGGGLWVPVGWEEPLPCLPRP